MEHSQLLAIYLRDHHAAASGAVEFVRRIIKSNRDNAFGRQAEALAAEIVEDQRTLEEVMQLVDVGPSRVKDAGARLAEKLGRLKLNGQLTGYSPLSRVVEFEGLSMAIAGKLCLWRALQVARQSDERLARFEPGRLVERARDQLDRTRSLHLQAVEVAFLDSDGS
jgi:hypothetical protein